MIFLVGLLVLWGVLNKSKLAIWIQIVVLVVLIINSLFLTMLIPLVGLYTLDDLYYIMVYKFGLSDALHATILFFSTLLPAFSVNFGFIILPVFYIFDICSARFGVDWIKYDSIIMGPLTLISSIVCLVMVVKYYRETG